MYPDGNPSRIILVACLIVGGFILFGILSHLGKKYSEKVIEEENTAVSNASRMCRMNSINSTRNESQRNNNEEEEHLRKLSLGAQAARKA